MGKWKLVKDLEEEEMVLKKKRLCYYDWKKQHRMLALLFQNNRLRRCIPRSNTGFRNFQIAEV